ncbi:MAG: EamA family transporter [Anaerolineae bacterium]|nr:EamA family transporter [Anaerolineae bacterium]
MKQFALLFVAIVFNVAGQLAMKRGMTEVGFITGELARLPAMAVRAFTTPHVLLGFVAYFVSAVLWLIVLSRVELSLAYPVVSLGYVLVVLTSWLLLGEQVNLLRWLGVFVICVGVYLVTRS